MGALYDVAADLVEMKLHGLCVDVRQGKRGASAARRANGAKQVGALVALIGGLTRSRTAPCPLPHQAVLLADPGFVLHEASVVNDSLASLLFPLVQMREVRGGSFPQPKLHHLTCGRAIAPAHTRMPHARGSAPVEARPT